MGVHPFVFLTAYLTVLSVFATEDQQDRSFLSLHDNKRAIMHPWCLSYSPDGRTLAVGGAGLQLWDVSGVSPVKCLEAAAGEFILSTSFAADSHLLATISGMPRGEPVPASPGLVKLWNWKTGKQLAVWKGHREPTNSRLVDVSFSPDGRLLASSCNEVIIWNVKDGKQKRVLPTAVGPVRFLPDGKSLVSCSSADSHSIRVWDVESGKVIHSFTLPPPAENIVTFALSSDGKYLAASDEDRLIVWSIPKKKVSWQVRTKRRGVTAIAFSPDGKLIGVARWQEHPSATTIRDSRTGVVLLTLAPSIHPLVLSIAFSPDGSRLAQATATFLSAHTVAFWGEVRLYDIRRARRRHSKLDFDTPRRAR